jgi:hypothetical protein
MTQRTLVIAKNGFMLRSKERRAVKRMKKCRRPQMDTFPEIWEELSKVKIFSLEKVFLFKARGLE